MNKNRKLFATVLILLVCLNSGCSPIEEKPDYIAEITEYSYTHSELTFEQVVEVEWDIAFQQQDPYNGGNEIKGATGYEFEVGSLRDQQGRLLFFSDGELVEEIVFEKGIFLFPKDVFVFRPYTIFIIEWVSRESMDGSIREYLQLRLKE